MALEVITDGLSYCIELSRAASGGVMEAILREDSAGWLLTETTRGVGSEALCERIGRRKQWQKALADALLLMENELIKREEV